MPLPGWSAEVSDAVLSSRLLQAFGEFPETVGFVSKAAAQESREQRWKAAITTLAAKYQLSAGTLESYLEVLAQKFLAAESTPALVRAQAHLVRKDFAQSAVEALRVVRDTKKSPQDKGEALLISVVSAAESGSAQDVEASLMRMMKLVNEEPEGWWMEGAESVVKLAARTGQEEVELKMLQQASARSAKTYGTRDGRTLRWHNLFGNALYRAGRSRAAATVLGALWVELKAVYGEEAPQTVTIGVSLVDALRAAGNLEEASLFSSQLARKSSLAREMLAARTTPADIPQGERTPAWRSRRSRELSAQNDVSTVLYEQERYDEAERLLRNTLDEATRDLGQQDDLTMMIRNNLAVMLYNTGKAEESEAMLRELIEIRAKSPKPDWTQLHENRNNLANALSKQGRNFSALIEYQRVLAWREENLGRYDLKTISARQNIGVVLEDLGWLCDAAFWGQSVMLHGAATRGPGHFSTIKNWSVLADRYSKMGLGAMAMRNHEEILTRMVDTYGSRHEKTIGARIDYVWSLLRCCENDEAYRQAELAREDAFQESLGKGVGLSKNQYDYAERTLKEARISVDAQKQAQLIERVAIIDSVAVLAYAQDHAARQNARSAAVEKLWRAKQYEKALAECEAILAELQTLKELNSPANFHLRHLRADCLRRLERPDEAYLDLKELLDHATRALGEENDFTMAVRFSLAQALRKLWEPREAVEHLKQVVAHHAQVFGARHEATLMAKFYYAVVLTDISRFEECRQHLWQVRDGLTQTHGEKDLVLEAVENQLVLTRCSVVRENKPSAVPFRLSRKG